MEENKGNNEEFEMISPQLQNSGVKKKKSKIKKGVETALKLVKRKSHDKNIEVETEAVVELLEPSQA